MLAKLLVANRGEIACRIMRTARRMGIATVAVYSEADRRAAHVGLADEAVCIGPAPARESYLSIERICEAARTTGADAVHPGYGFLSENAAFARALTAEGVVFVGPPAEAIEAMGDKIAAKRIAAEAGVSLVPGTSGPVADDAEAMRAAGEIGYPVMIKASAGGGGKGMRVAQGEAEMAEALQAARSEAMGAFGDDRLMVETFAARPRHVEIQILADAHGHCIHLGERECSIQRRHQKVIEEAPSPALDPETRARMGAQAIALARAVGYASAGTVEFILDARGVFYFLEMNTRLQVEHPVTELVTGLDIVEWMLRIARGERLTLSQDDIALDGAAVEARVYAEDPYRGFLPSVGRLTRYRPPAEARGPDRVVRNDAGVEEGGAISTHYDPMIAKLATWAPERGGAIAAMRAALDTFEIAGVGHNVAFLSAVMAHPRFAAGDVSTAFIAEEYPDGFHGARLGAAELARLAAAAAAMGRRCAERRLAVSGGMANHAPAPPDTLVVTAQATCFRLRVAADDAGTTVRFADGHAVRVAGDWRPGGRLARLDIDGSELVAKVRETTAGFRLATAGAELTVTVRPPREAALAALMRERAAADTSRTLLCPMPGQVVAVHVAAGEEVREGQALVTVEAMKMENVLRAERRATVADVAVAPGDGLAADDVIVTFE